MRLMREARCTLFEGGSSGAVTNSWAGGPTTEALAPYVVLRAIVEGPVDRDTGYVCNIGILDRLLRGSALKAIEQSSRGSANGAVQPAPATRAAFRDLARANAELHPSRLVSLVLFASPHLWYVVGKDEPDVVGVTRCFEFSASHRLHNPRFTEQQNQQAFGKCANPSSHGHNYVLEITVTGVPDPASGKVIDVALLDRVVKEKVIDRFDHKHLNVDCPEFASLIPSVENIARTIWDLLEGSLSQGSLSCVRVWETPKTYAEYSGE